MPVARPDQLARLGAAKAPLLLLDRVGDTPLAAPAQLRATATTGATAYWFVRQS